MAARVAPFRVGAAHQSLHHFVAKAAWDDAALLTVVRGHALPAIEEHGPIRAWIVDDTGLPKKGRLSVGVARQYCGQLGKQDNCQVAVTLSIANEHASLPIAYRLYLPEGWARDPARRPMAGVPEDIGFATKPEIALEQIRRAVADGVPHGVVVTDAGYGNDTGFREGVTAWAWPTWPASRARRPCGRPAQDRCRPSPGLAEADHQAAAPGRRTGPLAAKELALGLPPRGGASPGGRAPRASWTSRFAAVRVRPAHRDTDRAEPRTEEWLLVEWPVSEKEPTKYWLSTLPGAAPIEELVATAKLRWRIERDFEELKQELGLGHFEGRGWRGFHRRRCRQR